jgi:uncharacterized protein (DUF849 family)
LLIKACLNGSREPGALDALPLTPEALAADAERVVAAGARALHIHPRRPDGTQSLDAEDVAAALTAIRARCPDIPVGVTTAAWIEPDVSRRLRKVQEWTVLPDFASVNFSEPGVADLCRALSIRGIGIEAGLSTAADVALLIELGLVERCLRILIEPDEEAAEAALASVAGVIESLDKANISLPRLLHGFDTTTWPVLDFALSLGYDTRIGLEDTLALPDGSLTQGNAELVSLVVSRAAEKGLFC